MEALRCRRHVLSPPGACAPACERLAPRSRVCACLDSLQGGSRERHFLKNLHNPGIVGTVIESNATSQVQIDRLEASSTSVHPSQHHLAGPRDRLPKSCPAIPKIGGQPVFHSGQAVEPKRFGTSLFSTRAGDKQSFRPPISFGASQPVLRYALCLQCAPSAWLYRSKPSLTEPFCCVLIFVFLTSAHYYPVPIRPRKVTEVLPICLMGSEIAPLVGFRGCKRDYSPTPFSVAMRI